MIEVTKMNPVIDKMIQNLETTDPNTDEFRTTADTLVKLLDRATEMERLNQEAIDKAATRERNLKNDILDHDLKREQLDNERVNEWVKHALTVGTTVLTVGLTVWGTKVSLKFEEQGTITTGAGREFFKRLFSKK
jgi:septum formation inhibitor MinC